MDTLDVIYIASIFYIFWSIVKILHFLYNIISNFKNVLQAILRFFKRVSSFLSNSIKPKIVVVNKNTQNVNNTYIDEIPFTRFDSNSKYI